MTEITEIIFDEDITEEPYEKDKSRAKRRRNNIRKASRKRNIDGAIHYNNYYDNLHQYSKNKIHCSCPLCAFNHKKNKYKNYPIQDLKRFEAMNYEDDELLEKIT